MYIYAVFIFLDNTVREHEVMISFYSKLVSVLQTVSLVSHLIAAKVITFAEAEELDAIGVKFRKVHYLLKKICASLKSGLAQSFYIFLSIVEEHGNFTSVKVISEMKKEIESYVGKYLHLIVGK